MDGPNTIAFNPDLDIALLLEEDPAENDELFSFRSKDLAEPDKRYRPSEQQLIQEGKLGESELSARIQKAMFGTFNGQSACLILIRVDFCPKGGGRGWFRFRKATVQADFSEIDQPDDEGESDDGDEEEDSSGPLVLRLYPELIRGHIQSAAQKYNIKGYVEPAAAGVGAAVGVEKTFVSEGLHLVQGRLIGDPERGAKWTMAENEVSSSGIYEQPTFAVIVRYEPDKGFAMRLSMRATTYGGLAVKGKKGPRITFVKGTLPDDNALEDMDLEGMTEMRSKLLGNEGPGGG